MQCQNNIIVSNYLYKFNQILHNMSCQMLTANLGANITIDFIKCMIPHHKAAIYMCQNLLEYTNFQPLQNISHNIIAMQTKGIEQMSEIARTTPNCFNFERDVYCYITKYLSITESMIYRMKNSPKCMDINLNFTNEMIPHHEGAIAMCDNLLKYCIDPRLEEVANSIIVEQSEGVRQLKEIRKNICNNI